MFHPIRNIIGYRRDGRPIFEIAGADKSTDEAQPTDYLDRLTGEYDTHLEAIEEIVQRAKTDNDRALTSDEDGECKSHQDAAEKLLPQIQRWRELRETRQKAVTLRDGVPPAQRVARVKVTERSGGDEKRGDEVPDEKASEAALRHIERSAGHFLMDRHRASQGDQAAAERIQRALAKVLTSDTPGLLPTPFVGDVIGRLNAVRPLVNSATKVPLPASGMQWKRPKITQHTKVGVQTTEKTEVASQTLTVGSLDVSLKTLAGAVNMSIQEIERTDPSALNMVFSDLAANYGKASESQAATTFTSGISGSESLTLQNGATIDQIRGSLYQASGLIYGAINGEMPNVIYASMDQWARLGQFARQVNPQDRDVTSVPDSLSLSVAGLRVVVSSALPGGTLVIGNSGYFEVTESAGAPVQLRALEVGILGYEVGVFGLFGSVVTEDGAFVKLVPPVWVASTDYAVNDEVDLGSGKILQATAAGTSGTSKPTAPSSVGGTVTDGTVTWKRIA